MIFGKKPSSELPASEAVRFAESAKELMERQLKLAESQQEAILMMTKALAAVSAQVIAIQNVLIEKGMVTREEIAAHTSDAADLLGQKEEE